MYLPTALRARNILRYQQLLRAAFMRRTALMALRVLTRERSQHSPGIWTVACLPVYGLLVLEGLFDSLSLERQRAVNPSLSVLTNTFVLMQCFCGNMYPDGEQYCSNRCILFSCPVEACILSVHKIIVKMLLVHHKHEKLGHTVFRCVRVLLKHKWCRSL